jgi:probable HAF family extracellular repeat protein
MVIYQIRALGDPSTQSMYRSNASGLNNTGMVVGSVQAISTGNNVVEAVYWNPSPTVIPLGDVWSEAKGVNDSGDVVGTREADSFYNHAFLFRGGGVHDLAGVIGGPASAAIDINNAGVIAGWAGESSGQRRAFTYNTKSGRVNDLNVLFGLDGSYATAINNLGQVVGVSSKSDGASMFLFDGEILNELGPAPPVMTPTDINDTGQVVGSHRLNGAEFWTAFRCDTSGGSPQFVDLGLLPGFLNSTATAINNDGNIVGQSGRILGSGSQTQIEVHAFICRAGGRMQDLNELIPANSGWELVWADDINNKGQIAGSGWYNGRFQAYLLTPTSPFQSSVKALIDPMALILGQRLYLIWVELHHPHEPKLSDLNVAIRLMSAAERQAALERARRLGDFGKQVETIIAKMIDVK